MYRKKLTVWIVLITLINSVFAGYIKIGSIMPDVLFTFVLCYAVVHEKPVGVMTVAAICGAVLDCLTGRIFGIYTSVYLVSAVLIYILRDCIYKEWIVIDVIFVFLVTLIGKSLVYLINISIFKDTGYAYALMTVILPEALYNTLISCVIFPLIRRTLKRKAGNFI